MQASNDPDPTPTPLYLWRVLRAYIEHACTLTGLPAALAQRLWLSRAEHRFFCALLRPLETLLRRLVFLDAIKCAPEPPKPETKQRAKRAMNSACGAAFHMDNPESWRVRFNIGANMDRRRPRRHASTWAGEAPAVHDGRVAAAPLALRLEALIRGFNDPAPLVRRLARILHRSAAHACSIARCVCARLSKHAARHPLAAPALQAGDLCAAALRADSS